MKIVAFLGAGFSVPAGLPCGNALFEPIPISHSRKADADTLAVLQSYTAWRTLNPEARAEEFITAVQDAYDSLTFGSYGTLWPRLVRFLAYRLATPFATVYSYESHTSRARDNIFEASIDPVHQEWWDTLLRLVIDVDQLTIITTNWDILIERALRPAPMLRAPRRPGFHYGNGIERLKATTTYPRSKWRADPTIRGNVAVLKLHGSLNWAIEDNRLVKYGDLRPAFRGDAAIVPPTQYKAIPTWAMPIWQQAEVALHTADRTLVVGYSFPPYDKHVWRLFENSAARSENTIYVFDPDALSISERLQNRFPLASITPHAGLPEGTSDLQRLRYL